MQGTDIDEKGTSALGNDLHEHGALDLDLVSAFAGDRPLTEPEAFLMEGLIKDQRGTFYTELLYVISNTAFPSATAEGLWNEILRHKVELSAAVQRNVGVAVAALDYLANLKGELKSPTLIGEAHVADITRLVLRDGLTRLFNHTTCLEKIAVEMRIYQRYGRAASLMMVDVDDFKSINDRHGHPEGDKVLAALGALIDASTRSSDICCRYGGEEFAVILPATETAEAGLLAERLRVQAEAARFKGRRVTISIGVASFNSTTTTDQAILRKADAALYQAKREGKNRVVVCP